MKNILQKAVILPLIVITALALVVTAISSKNCGGDHCQEDSVPSAGNGIRQCRTRRVDASQGGGCG